MITQLTWRNRSAPENAEEHEAQYVVSSGDARVHRMQRHRQKMLRSLLWAWCVSQQDLNLTYFAQEG